jgi:hypothetical protein
MIQRIAPVPGGIDEYAQILARGLLADEFGKAFRAERGVRILGALGRIDQPVGIVHDQVSSRRTRGDKC